MSLDWSAELIVASVSGFIALVALGTAIFEGFTTRKHNRLSVKPLLDMSAEGQDLGNITKVIFNLSNVGLGPAIIKQFIMLINDRKHVIKSSLEAENFKAEVLNYGFIKSQLVALSPGATLAAGERLELFGGDCLNIPTVNMLPLHRIGVMIEYQSIYKNETFHYQELNALRAATIQTLKKPEGRET